MSNTNLQWKELITEAGQVPPNMKCSLFDLVSSKVDGDSGG